MGIIVAIGVLFGIFGSRRHNKFALSASLCCNCFACFILFIVVVTIMVQVSPTYPPSVASACVARGAEAAPISDKCMKYYTDMGNIRLFRLWMSDYVKSETQPVVRAYMLGIEDGHFCCGWGPPLQCENVRWEIACCCSVCCMTWCRRRAGNWIEQLYTERRRTFEVR